MGHCGRIGCDTSIQVRSSRSNGRGVALCFLDMYTIYLDESRSARHSGVEYYKRISFPRPKGDFQYIGHSRLCISQCLIDLHRSVEGIHITPSSTLKHP